MTNKKLLGGGEYFMLKNQMVRNFPGPQEFVESNRSSLKATGIR